MITALAVPCSARADDTVSTSATPGGNGRAGVEWRFGMSGVFSGPAAELGLEMRAGLLAGFERANRGGGVRGHPIRLIALDDAYEPARASANVRRLLDDERVHAIVGNVGTPTAIAALPICDEKKSVFYAAYTGASLLRRDPPDPNVFNVRAGYVDEAEAIVAALTGPARLEIGDVAVFSQRDGYGDSGFAAVVAAFERRGMPARQKLRHVRYERNTLAVEGALADLICAERRAKAVVMVGTHAPCAKFIRLAHDAGFRPLFVAVSFSGGNALAHPLRDMPARLIVTQVVPHPEADLPLLRQYREDLKRMDPQARPSFGSLEGYIAARLLTDAIEKANPEVARSAVAKALEGLGRSDLDLGGPEIRFGPKHHDGCHGVWATMLRDGVLAPCTWDELIPAPTTRRAQ